MNIAVAANTETLPALIDRAALALSNARSAAEILEAREMASFAYDMAKREARMERAKKAHDEVVGAAYRAQADALDIEAQAKRRLADEYDAAQERGEISVRGQHGSHVPDGNMRGTVEDIGLTRKAIHEARQIRDAEAADPGVVRRALDDRLGRGEEPTRSAMRQMVSEAAQRGLRGGQQSGGRRNPMHQPNPRFDAMASVAGSCRSIITKIEETSVEYIISGFLDDGMRDRNLATIRKCRDTLTDILEASNAE